MVDVDELLRTTLKRVAEPGDPTGVADAIRSRVAAGDTGSPANQPPFGLGSWLPWAGAGLVVAVAGTALGASGLVGPALFGDPAGAASAPAAIAAGQLISGGLCPGETGAATFRGGERVLALKRSDDSGWLAVRDPASVAGLVWLPTSVVVVDTGQAAIDSLPVGGCLTPVVTAMEESPASPPGADPQPQPAPAPIPAPVPVPVPVPPPPAGDTQAPAIQQAWATPTSLYSTETAIIHVLASDNVGVTAVNATWTGPHSGSAALTKVGSEWRLSYTFPASAPSGTVTFTLTARDAAGRVSPSQTVAITGIYFG